MEDFKREWYQTIEEAKTDFENLKNHLGKIKLTGNFKYSDYTEDKLEEIQFWLNHSKLDDDMKVVKALEVSNEIKAIHFTGKLDLNYILSFSNSSDKVLQFIKYCNELSDEEYWEQLANAYIMQDYNSIPYEIVVALFNADKTGKENLMDEDELELLNGLPDTFTIYRAMTVKEKESGKYRFSWTLNEEVAQDFLERNTMLYNDEMTIHSIEVNKKDVLAYLNGRSEEEIIYIQKNGNS